MKGFLILAGPREVVVLGVTSSEAERVVDALQLPEYDLVPLDCLDTNVRAAVGDRRLRRIDVILPTEVTPAPRPHREWQPPRRRR